MELQLRLYPDPVLLRVAEPVTAFDQALADKVARMFELMYEEQGVGLAAPQVGWSGRVLVLNPSGHKRDAAQELALVNPRIVKRWGKERAEEGCLSFPEIFVEVERAAGVKLQWQDVKGEAHEEDIKEFRARIVQHELDHLDGVLLWHRMSPVDRIRWRRELEELVDALESGERAGAPAGPASGTKSPAG
jgi:peptide deformylase